MGFNLGTFVKLRSNLGQANVTSSIWVRGVTVEVHGRLTIKLFKGDSKEWYSPYISF